MHMPELALFNEHNFILFFRKFFYSISKPLNDLLSVQVHRLMMSKERDEYYQPMEKNHIVKILENGQVKNLKI